MNKKASQPFLVIYNYISVNNNLKWSCLYSPPHIDATEILTAKYMVKIINFTMLKSDIGVVKIISYTEGVLLTVQRHSNYKCFIMQR